MNIYKLAVDDYEALEVDDLEAVVIIAANERQAREWASAADGDDERWLGVELVYVVLLGTATPDVVASYPNGIVVECRARLY